MRLAMLRCVECVVARRTWVRVRRKCMSGVVERGFRY